MLLLFTARPHINPRFTVKHEKTEDEDENENEDEGCRLTPTPHWLPATDYSRRAGTTYFGAGLLLFTARAAGG
jgi:hypothetical protein